MPSATLHAGAPTTVGTALDDALTGGLRAVYQPIVTLADGGVVGYEALTRGPAGSELESPLALFANARAAQRVPELDRACRTAAIAGARRAGLGRPATLFLNAEPEALEIPAIGPIRESAVAAGTELQLCVEITERALTARPADLLAAVDRLRREGFMIALDDVGVDPRSLGASLAQGWFFGHPASAAELRPVTRQARALAIQARTPVSSPVELMSEHRSFTVGRKDVLLSVTRALEAQALGLGGHTVVISTFQHARHFTPATARRYAELARRTAFVAALGAGLGPEPVPGVRGIALDTDDVLVGEWDIAVLGPHYSGALVARDLGDAGPDRERRFEFVLTFERTLVVDVAAALISRLAP